MHYWQGADGVTLAGDAWGTPSGPLVLLQHGGGQTRHAWKSAGEQLGAAGYHAIAFDARGHGDSDWAPDGHYGQDVMVEDLKCVVAALGDRRPVLVGASMGGGTSLVAVGEDHVDATALVMVDIAPRIEPDGVAKIQGVHEPEARGVRYARGGRRRDRQLPAASRASAKPRRPREERPARRRRQVPLALGSALSRRATRCGQTPAAPRGVRARLRLPTLLVRGGLSDVLTEEGAHEFLALCPHSEYVSVGSAGTWSRATATTSSATR